MNAERFQALIAAYGAEFARWPAAERGLAENYARDHPAAADALSAERDLDAVLDAWTLPPITADLRERALAAAPVGQGLRTARLAWRRFWLPGAGLAAACAAGAVAGGTLIGPSLANAFPAPRAETAGFLSDGVSILGAPVDVGAPG